MIAATDGIFDNVFDQRIAEIVTLQYIENLYYVVSLCSTTSSIILFRRKAHINSDETLVGGIAKTLAIEANKIGMLKFGDTPFSVNARRNRLRFDGGKLDDCTVVCAMALPDGTISQTASSSVARSKL